MTASRFPIEAGHVMAFARAVGDFNPVYHDAAAAAATEVGGLIAPPTFVQASAQYDPDYPLRPRPGVVWFGSGRTPSGLVRDDGSGSSGGAGGGGTGLHAEQHYEYHRPVRPGEVLTPTVRDGASWEKQGRRGGLLQFRESITEYRGEDGELVVVARAVGVRTAKTVGS
jgi:acyl dehydratase